MRPRLFANSLAVSICEFPTIFFANEFTAPKDDTKIRWAMLAPFGDWPNKQGLQRVTKADAANIVADFEKPANVLKRKVGIPFYIGHPDHPDFKDRYKDTKAYGRIKEMEVRDDGLWAGIKFNGEGEQLIADEAFDGHSVNWFLRPDPKEKGVWRPFKVKSAGFTNEPNLPVPPITTANETQQENIFKRLARLRLFCNQSEKQADTMPSRVKLSAEQIKLGAEAKKDYKAGNNPASWVEDEDIWEKAKEAALKTYDETDDFFWAAVTHIYENMGGGVSSGNERRRNLANGDVAGHEFHGNQWTGGLSIGSEELKDKVKLAGETAGEAEVYKDEKSYRTAASAFEKAATAADAENNKPLADYLRGYQTKYSDLANSASAANEGTTEGAHKGAIVKHGTVKAREKLQAAKDRAVQSSNAANAASSTAAANGGKAHEAAKSAHSLAADHHVEAGHRAKALGMDSEADGHFQAANGHRAQMDKHAAEMMNAGEDMEFDAVNMRYRKMSNMRKPKAQ